MSDRIYLNYDDIVKEESVVVDYLAKNSDRFSVTAVIKRPYSQLPPDFNYGVQLQPFVENYIFERKDINTSMDFNRKKCRILQKNR